MTRAGNARDAVMHSIRDHLAASAPYDAVVHLGPPDVRVRRAPLPIVTTSAASDSPPIDRVHRFVEQITGVGASCDIVRDEREAAVALGQSLSNIGARRIVGSDAPLAQRAIAALGRDVESQAIADVSREELFACDAGITTAQLAIAETGTLVLESSREKNRLLSLVPPAHIALLAAGDICDSLSDVLARLRSTQTSPDGPSHAVTFITGPSRTSDIELTLTIGVHGPRLLHVIILENSA